MGVEVWPYSLTFDMDLTDILREILPAEIVDDFDLVRYEKTSSQFDIWCDEKKVQSDTDTSNPKIVSNGFGDYKCIQDYPLHGRPTHPYVNENGLTRRLARYSAIGLTPQNTRTQGYTSQRGVRFFFKRRRLILVQSPSCAQPNHLVLMVNHSPNYTKSA